MGLSIRHPSAGYGFRNFFIISKALHVHDDATACNACKPSLQDMTGTIVQREQMTLSVSQPAWRLALSNLIYTS